MKPLPRYNQYMVERSTTNFENYIKALRSVGRAVEVDHVVFDGESVFRRRFACDTRTCSPTTNPATKVPWRESGAKSCCADLVVDLSPIEIRALERHWDAIGPWLASKDRFFEGKSAKDCLVLSSDFEVSLRKRANRCIFAIRDADWGIRCGIHSACMAAGIPLREAKPVVCDTFPLIIMDLEGGRFYVGAHDADSEGIAGLGDDPITAYPCLADPRKGEPMYVEMEPVLRAYFGEEHYRKTVSAAGEYLARPRPPKPVPVHFTGAQPVAVTSMPPIQPGTVMRLMPKMQDFPSLSGRASAAPPMIQVGPMGGLLVSVTARGGPLQVTVNGVVVAAWNFDPLKGEKVMHYPCWIAIPPRGTVSLSGTEAATLTWLEFW